MLNKLIIDSSYSKTELCKLGEKYNTDKSPYNKDASLHKHPYTAIYDLLFFSIRNNEITLGEIGILNNASIKCWRKYFPNAKIWGFEYDEHLINKAKRDELNVQYEYIDVTNKESINIALSDTKFDILIDDSTHQFEHQINIIESSIPFLSSEGILIIEDIFINEKEDKYAKAMEPIMKYFSSVMFIEATHSLKWSPGWNNDKLLILYRNDVPYDNNSL